MRCNVEQFRFTDTTLLDFTPMWHSASPSEEECRALLDFQQSEHTAEEWQDYLNRLGQSNTFWSWEWAVPLRAEHPLCGQIDLLDPEVLALVKDYRNLAELLLCSRPTAFLSRHSFPLAAAGSLILSPVCAASLFGSRQVLELLLDPGDPDEVGGGFLSYGNPGFSSPGGHLLTPYTCALLGEQGDCAERLRALGAECAPDSIPMQSYDILRRSILQYEQYED